MIDDEVMAGWGRTGKWFAIDRWGVKPDILVTAKGITSAYVRWAYAQPRRRSRISSRIIISPTGIPMKRIP